MASLGIATVESVTAPVECREGDWFAVPLRDGGYGVGVVARMNREGVLVGYFFGPKRENVPSSDGLEDLRASDAVMVRRFGDLGIRQRTWPVIGRLHGWDRDDWPMPVFVRYEELTGRSFRVFYDEDDPIKLIREELVSPGMDEQGPKDGLCGTGFVEKVLTKQLS